MIDWKRQTTYYLLTLVAVMLGYAVVYHEAMAAFEGREPTFLHSLQVVVETFTTTGFGSDAPWWSPEMNLLVIVMDLTGVVLIFMALPVFVFPLLEERLSTTVPTSVAGYEDHVVICAHTPRGETLVQELDSMDVASLFVVSDRDEARDLYERGRSVIHGDPESVETLEGACVADARALVADADDETNASVVLSAKEAAPDTRVVSLIESPEVADYHRYAGADLVVSPRRMLGERLASKATTAVSANLGEGGLSVGGDGIGGDEPPGDDAGDGDGSTDDENEGDEPAVDAVDADESAVDAVEIGGELEIAELLVHRGSPLVGERLADSGVADLRGTNVIGAWFRGEFVTPPSPDDVIDEHTILLVAGPESQLERLKELTLSATRHSGGGAVLVAGYGEVGSTVAEALAAAGSRTVVVDRVEGPGVDVVGDATDPQTLSSAGIEDARSVVFALADDTATIFATLVAKQLAPAVEVIARANDAENVPKLYRAGAEYVLALSTVSGRMLASDLLDEEIISPSTQIEIVRTAAPRLAGRSLAQADVRARTNCTVIAAERGGEILTEIGPDFVVRDDDALIVAGTDGDINRFNELAS
ncbi:potassium channel family protein [Halegenticoccus tardaugens]|uniref:potassium channel family protein n=1 Tax=Halegenticoccus tardaugens TaxID=2071624 RepID=UPI001E4B7363|nr:NAD-binding protein [Halegenticoccus tardaugens]